MAQYEFAVIIDVTAFPFGDLDEHGFYDGALAWITGRPGFDGGPILTGAPINIATLAAQAQWKEGIISKDRIGVPRYSVDIEELGGYGNSSDMTITVRNTQRLIHDLTNIEFYLYRCRIRFYVVSDATFIQYWTGTIESIAWDETELSIRCIDFGKQIHKEFPPNSVDIAVYPSAKEAAIGKVIPVCIGKVNHAPLMNVGGKSFPIAVYKNGATEYKQTVATGSTGAKFETITLKTGTLTVNANQWAGKWLDLVRGSSKKIVQILANTGSDGSASTTVTVTLDGYFEKASNAAQGSPPNVWAASNTNPETWWFQILETVFPRVLSDKAVYQIEKYPDNSSEVLETYDKDFEKWLDLSAAKHLSNSASCQECGGRPGFLIRSRDILETESKVQIQRVLKPSSVVLVASSADYGIYNGATESYATKTGLTVVTALDGADANLNDGNRATSRKIVIRKDNTLGLQTVMVKVAFDLNLSDPPFALGYNSISIAPRLRAAISGTIPGSGIYTRLCVKVQVHDILGGLTTPINLNKGEYSGSDPDLNDPDMPSRNGRLYVLNTTSVFNRLFDGIPPEYYGLNEVGNRTDVSIAKNALALSETLLAKSKEFNPFNKIRVTIEFFVMPNFSWSIASNDLTLEVMELCVSANRTIDSAPEELAAKVQGQTFGTTWDARRTAANPVLNIADVPEYLIRAYDEKPDYIDGATTDAAVALRSGWTVGRSVGERKNNADWIRELCEEGFFCVVPAANGKRKVIPWYDITASGFAFNTANIIHDSFSKVEETPIRRCFNEFDLSYDYDPGLKKFKRRILIKNPDSGAWPTATAFDGALSAVTYYDYSRGLYAQNLLTITFNTANPLQVGDYVKLTGGYGGYAITSLRVMQSIWNGPGHPSAPNFGLAIVEDSTGNITALTPGVSYTTGAIQVYDEKVPKWKKLVQGIESYSTAQSNWNSAQDKWEVTKTKNMMRKEFKWFGSNADWGGSADSDAPLLWLAKAIDWLGAPKRKCKLKVSINPANLALYLGQKVTFTDAFLTDALTLTAWVTDISLVTTTGNSHLEIGLIWRIP